MSIRERFYSLQNSEEFENLLEEMKTSNYLISQDDQFNREVLAKINSEEKFKKYRDELFTCIQTPDSESRYIASESGLAYFTKDLRYTVSFCLFDDMKPIIGPLHRPTTLESEDLKTQILSMIPSPDDDPSCFFNDDGDFNLDTIIYNLQNWRYYVQNRYNKYYVIAFAINYARFDIYSKDYKKRLIDWGPDTPSGAVVNTVDDEEYNEGFY